MAIRALDYTPPIHIEFGDFLSALLTADGAVRADDSRHGLREAVRTWFARYGIAPPTSTTEDGWWRTASVHLGREGVRFASLQTDPIEMFRLVWANREHLELEPTAYMRIESLRPCRAHLARRRVRRSARRWPSARSTLKCRRRSSRALRV